MKKFLIALLVLLALILAWPWLLRAWIHWRMAPAVFEAGRPRPATGVALVLGAGLQQNGQPTPVLHDRVATAVDLYKTGVVKKLLLSGDNRFEYYNEPEAMRRLAIELGAANQDLVLDYAGRRTYDSCYRAKAIFRVDELVVVTQRFHLDRALYLCNAVGIKATGAIADRRPYSGYNFWQIREVAATVRAWLDVNVFQPEPVLGEQLPIKIAGN